MDEKDFITDSYDHTHVLVCPGNAQVNRQQKTPDNRDFVTVVEKVSAEGSMISSLIIFKGKELVVNWAESSSLTDKFLCLFYYSTNSIL